MSKIKNGGLDQYGAEPFEQQQFGTAGVKGLRAQLGVLFWVGVWRRWQPHDADIVPNKWCSHCREARLRMVRQSESQDLTIVSVTGDCDVAVSK